MTIEKLLKELMETCRLGEIIAKTEPVEGGFLHRMYKVTTETGTYAVKHLNPEIMKRPTAVENYARAEKIERILEENQIPIVPSLVFDGKKMQTTEGQFFYIFKWQKGKITDWGNISKEQCYMAGNILGRIHAIELEDKEAAGRIQAPELSRINWQGYLQKAKEENSPIAALLEENEALFLYAEAEMNKARIALPPVICMSDEDMDPKNIMWDEKSPRVIDLECLDYGNPASHALQLSLQWAGVVTCELDIHKMNAYLDGYLAAYDNNFRDYENIFGVAYTWVEWLEYNIRRALGECVDEAERDMGILQVKQTTNRLAHIKENESRIKEALRLYRGEKQL